MHKFRMRCQKLYLKRVELGTLPSRSKKRPDLVEKSSSLSNRGSRVSRSGLGGGHGVAGGSPASEQSAGGKKLGIEKGGAGSTADEVVRKQSEFYIEQRALADAAHYCGHAVSRVNVAARLRAVFFFQDDDGLLYGSRQ
jgi:hypothetical protein